MSDQTSGLGAYRIVDEPYYLPVAREIALFTAAYASRLPLMLRGPIGCGKTRFIEHMAWRLGRPLVVVVCHEGMTAADLSGRWLLDAQGTVWRDGPLTTAVREGAICYLDEIVEARQHAAVVIHPLTDDHRTLPLEARGELVHAHPDFHLVISYKPGYQSEIRDLKESTKQRFASLEFGYPDPAQEAAIVARETSVGIQTARLLVSIAEYSRNLKQQGLDEGASTRMLINAGRLITQGAELVDACDATLIVPLTDDSDIRRGLRDAVILLTNGADPGRFGPSQ